MASQRDHQKEPALQTTKNEFMTERHNDTYPAIDPLTKSNLDGKTVLVTGASKGIGSVIAIAYAKAGAANIALAARSSVDPTESEIFAAARSAGKAVPRVLKLQVDITNLKSVEAAARQTEEAFGKLDILVNNAGFLEKLGSIVDKDAEEWWTTWDINIRGTFHMARAFIPLLLAGRDKTMLNMNSIAAISYQPGASAYQASKLALLRLTELMVTEYGPQGLLAYSLHPGGVATDMSHKLPQAAHSLLVDTPELAADTIVFLTQERREWLAGRYIDAHWDVPRFLAMRDEIVNEDKLKVRMVW